MKYACSLGIYGKTDNGHMTECLVSSYLVSMQNIQGIHCTNSEYITLPAVSQKGSLRSKLIAGLGTILLISWLHCEGTEPRNWTKEVKCPEDSDETPESWTICSVSTSFATSPCNKSTHCDILLSIELDTKTVTAVYNTNLEVCTSFQKSCASIFIWTTSYYSDVHRTAKYRNVRLAYKTMHHIQDPIRMEISFYFLQKMRIPHKSPVGLIADSIVHCFVLTMLNVRPARNTSEDHSVDKCGYQKSQNNANYRYVKHEVGSSSLCVHVGNHQLTNNHHSIYKR